MQYHSTRDKSISVSSAEAIKQDLVQRADFCSGKLSFS